MRNLRTALLFIFLAVFASGSLAQTYGVKVGGNWSTFFVTEEGKKVSDGLDIIKGFHIGATAEFPITKLLSFQPEVLISRKGFKSNTKETLLGETYQYEDEANLTYVDIPLLLKGYADANGARFFVALGPYVGFGIAGKYKSSTSEHFIQLKDGWTLWHGVDKNEGDIKWGNDEANSDLKRFDAGVSFGVGATVDNFQFGIAYDLGLTNISPYTDNGFKERNGVFRVSVGYVFGGSDPEK